MLDMIQALEIIASKPPSDNSNSADIFLVTASGERVPITPGSNSLPNLLGVYQAPNPQQPDGGDEDLHLFAVSGLQRWHHYSAEVERGLRHRNWVAKHLRDGGHHFGGYHPGKNKRQNIPFAEIDGKLSDLEVASRLLGFPAVTLVAAQEVIGMLEEQRSYEVFASSREISGGNDHRNGYKA